MSKEQLSHINFASFLPAKLGQYERQAVERLQRFVVSPRTEPILNVSEMDLVLDSPSDYFTAVVENAESLAEQVSGDLGWVTQYSQAVRSDAQVRKIEVFADRVMTGLFAADSCRSEYHLVRGENFIPILIEDSPESLQARVDDYAKDLIQSARWRTVLRGASMDLIELRLLWSHDEDAGTKVALSGLAGVNAMKKHQLWIEQFKHISSGMESNKEYNKALRTMREYAKSRPEQYQARYDFLQVIDDEIINER